MSALWTPRLPGAVALHESAHAVVASLLSLVVTRVVLREDGTGYTLVPLDLPAVALRQAHADCAFNCAVAVLRAGAEAERRLLGTVQPGSADQDDEVVSMWISTYVRRYGAVWIKENLSLADIMLGHVLDFEGTCPAIASMGRQLESRGVLRKGDIARATQTLARNLEARAKVELACNT